MDQVNEKAKTVALDLVKQFAPDEAPMFDMIWHDLATSQEADSLPGVKHRVGIELPQEAWSMILIPLATAIVKKLVDVSVDAIVGWIRQRRGGVSNPKDTEVALAAINLAQSQRLVSPPEQNRNNPDEASQ